MSYITKESQDVKNIFNRFKKRDFSGIGGQVIKNSTYQLSTNIIFKLGSVFFTIIIARMLGVELFGLYSLALSTIVLFSAFSDLGIGTTLLTFVSKSLAKNNLKKAKSYFNILLKYKIYLTIISSLSLITCAYFLANNYYQKPIFYALLAGVLYIPASSFAGFLITVFQANNNFKIPMIKEIIFQLSKFTLIPIGILLLLKTTSSTRIIIGTVILLTGISWLISLSYLKISAKKHISYMKENPDLLTKKDKTELKKFISPLVLTVLSGMFYGYIDTIMLGHYISDVAYIGFYGVALSLVGSLAAIISFMPGVVLPIFSRLEKKSLDHIFVKIRNFTILLGLLSTSFVYFFAKYILLLYGKEFLQATIFLQLLSFMLILTPIIGLYDAYFASRKKTGIIATILILSTITNIVLNIVFINYGLQFGMNEAILGACFASLFSRGLHLTGFLIFKK